jgi:hypothetical protein
MPPQTLSAYYTEADGTPTELASRAQDDDDLDNITSGASSAAGVSSGHQVDVLDVLISRPRYDFWRARSTANSHQPVAEFRFARGTARAVNEPRRFPWQAGDELRLFDRHSHVLLLRGPIVEVHVSAGAASGTVVVKPEL